MSAPAAWWTQQPVLAFDVESTGVDPYNDRIVTASIVRIPVGVPPTTFDWLADPGVDIPTEATDVHGITPDHAREHGRPPVEVLTEVTMQLAWALGHGIPVVAANAAFDLTMLETENQRHGVPTLASRLDDGIRPVLDPMVLDKQADPYRRAKGGCGWTGRGGSPDRVCGCGATDKTLTGLCLHYGVTLDDAHTSSADALAAGLLVPQVLTQHARVFREHVSPSALHDAQVGWRAEQMSSLRRYFDRAGIEHDGCPGGWPTLPPPSGAQVVGSVDQPLDGVA